MDARVNPCLTCPDTCCALKGHDGLRLSRDEFEAYFIGREEDLRVRVENEIVVISTRDGFVCPNLGEKGCRIYQDRPIDCRLYPYQMLPVYETRKSVKFLLYRNPYCVENRRFSIPEAEAMNLILEFGKKAYGDRKIIVSIYREDFLAKAANKGASMLVKGCKKLGVHL